MGEREVRAAEPRGGGRGARRFEAREGRGDPRDGAIPQSGGKGAPLAAEPIWES